PSGEGHEIDIGGQEQEFDRPQQNDQIATVQEETEDADGKEDRSQYEVMSQSRCHFASPCALPAAALSRGRWMLALRTRSRARTRTCELGSVRLTSERLRKVSAIAAPMPT